MAWGKEKNDAPGFISENSTNTKSEMKIEK